MKYKITKKRFIILGLLMILEIIFISLSIRSYSNKFDNNKQVMFLEGDNGVYLESPNESYETPLYILNTIKSGCIDGNGNLINNSLSFDKATKELTTNIIGSQNCYLFFDKE